MDECDIVEMQSGNERRGRCRTLDICRIERYDTPHMIDYNRIRKFSKSSPKADKKWGQARFYVGQAKFNMDVQDIQDKTTRFLGSVGSKKRRRLNEAPFFIEWPEAIHIYSQG